jgi:hypothetical protein
MLTERLPAHAEIALLLPGALHDAVIVQRFVQEARTAVRLRSAHVARVRVGSGITPIGTGAQAAMPPGTA